MPVARVWHVRPPQNPMPTIRRALARRPWLFWSLVVVAALVAGSSVSSTLAALERERETWGRTVTVNVATREVAAGEPLDGATERRRMPAAVIPDDPATSIARGAAATQHIGQGEIIIAADVADDGAGGLAPRGSKIVAIVEPVPGGAEVGARAAVAADGAVLTEDAVVVGAHGDATLLAVHGDDAPAVAAAAVESRATLLVES